VQPYAAGRTVYAVGFRREKEHRITLKVERLAGEELREFVKLVSVYGMNILIDKRVVI
jgi:predicted DNA-binding protein (MmcQ/YjbR family)